MPIVKYSGSTSSVSFAAIEGGKLFKDAVGNDIYLKIEGGGGSGLDLQSGRLYKADGFGSSENYVELKSGAEVLLTQK